MTDSPASSNMTIFSVYILAFYGGHKVEESVLSKAYQALVKVDPSLLIQHSIVHVTNGSKNTICQ
jgi:hypothetical protein